MHFLVLSLFFWWYGTWWMPNVFPFMSGILNRDILENITAQGWIAWTNQHMLQYAPIRLQNQYSYLYHLVARQGLLHLTLFRWDVALFGNIACSITSSPFKQGVFVFVVCSSRWASKAVFKYARRCTADGSFSGHWSELETHLTVWHRVTPCRTKRQR